MVYSKRKNFLVEIMQKMRQRDQFQTFYLYFKKALYEVKTSGLQLRFNIFRQPSTWDTIKVNCMKVQTIDSRVMLNFDFLECGLRIVFPPHLVPDFSRKKFLMLHSINWAHYIVRLDCLYFLRYWAVCPLELFVFSL